VSSCFGFSCFEVLVCLRLRFVQAVELVARRRWLDEVETRRVGRIRRRNLRPHTAACDEVVGELLSWQSFPVLSCLFPRGRVPYTRPNTYPLAVRAFRNQRCAASLPRGWHKATGDFHTRCAAYYGPLGRPVISILTWAGAVRGEKVCPPSRDTNKSAVAPKLLVEVTPGGGGGEAVVKLCSVIF
jgi:hypothetical protein